MNPITYLVDNVMIPFLTFSYQLFPNYGISIILLTTVVKMAFYPLTQKQFVSMKKLQELQPKMKELQEKFKKEPEKLQKELMGFYAKHKVNPLSGCLPVLVQLPFFFAIFYTMNSTKFKDLLALPNINPGFLWLPNLGLPDPLFILPVVIAVTTYVSQKLSQTNVQNSQMQMFMMMMPVMMLFISLKLPSGVLLYWAVSQLLSMVHQYFIMKNAN